SWHRPQRNLQLTRVGFSIPLPGQQVRWRDQARPVRRSAAATQDTRTPRVPKRAPDGPILFSGGSVQVTEQFDQSCLHSLSTCPDPECLFHLEQWRSDLRAQTRESRRAPVRWSRECTKRDELRRAAATPR